MKKEEKEKKRKNFNKLYNLAYVYKIYYLIRDYIFANRKLISTRFTLIIERLRFKHIQIKNNKD